MKRLTQIAAAAAAFGIAAGAQAALFTGSFAGNGVSFDNFNGLEVLAGTPVQVNGAPFVAFSSSIDATLGAFLTDLGGNGIWGAGTLYAEGGTFSGPNSAGALVFNFGGTTMQKVGALLNAYADPAGGSAGITLQALNSMGGVLEQWNVQVSTPNGLNEGVFYGIERPTADIFAFRVTGTRVVMDDLTLSPVPEPSTYAMLLGGLGLIGLIARRRR
jgi:hypothetical protein